MIRAAMCLVLLGSCAGRKGITPLAEPGSVIERAFTRPTPDPVRARVHLKLVSKPMDLASGTHAVWIGDRPGKGHLAILGPLGGPVATITSDGAGLAIALPQERRLMAGMDANHNLETATGGMFGLDDLVGLLVGDLPFDEALVKKRSVLEDGSHFLQLVAPNGAELDIFLDPQTAAPSALAMREKTGRTLLSAEYAPFEALPEGPLVPTTVDVEVPALELQLDLRFKSWEVLDEAPPVFDLTAPEGWSVEPLEDALMAWGLSAPTGAHP